MRMGCFTRAVSLFRLGANPARVQVTVEAACAAWKLGLPGPAFVTSLGTGQPLVRYAATVTGGQKRASAFAECPLHIAGRRLQSAIDVVTLSCAAGTL